MTKSKLIERFATQQSYIPARTVEDAIREMLEHVTSTFVQGERTEIRGFGSFFLHYRAPRTGRDPKTGDKVELEGKYVPHFEPDKELRGRASIYGQVSIRAWTQEKHLSGAFSISPIWNWKLPRRVLSSFYPIVKFF